MVVNDIFLVKEKILFSMKVLVEIWPLFKQVDFRLLFINKANQENFVIKNNIMLHLSVQIHIEFFAQKVRSIDC